MINTTATAAYNTSNTLFNSKIHIAKYYSGQYVNHSAAIPSFCLQKLLVIPPLQLLANDLNQYNHFTIKDTNRTRRFTHQIHLKHQPSSVKFNNNQCTKLPTIHTQALLHIKHPTCKLEPYNASKGCL